MATPAQQVLAGLLSTATGIGICLIGAGVIPVPAEDVHAPGAIILLAGSVFLLAGIAILFRHRPVVAAIAGNLIIASFAAIGFWVAFAGASESFSGNLPLVSDSVSVAIARGFFGFGAALCLLLLIAGIRQVARLITTDKDKKSYKPKSTPL